MEKVLILFLVFFAAGFSEQADDNPCSDSLYLAFKSRCLDSLSEREYEYFKTKDNACNEMAKIRAEDINLTQDSIDDYYSKQGLRKSAIKNKKYQMKSMTASKEIAELKKTKNQSFFYGALGFLTVVVIVFLII